MKLSVIIPIGFKEKQLKDLLEDLKELPTDSEVLLLTSDLGNLSDIDIKNRGFDLRKILSKSGRARSMNLGAEKARGEFLWFVHADSKLDTDAIPKLMDAINKNPQDLFYFNLAFYDGPRLIKINELGVRFRTFFLKIPFGDQGFCIRKDVFENLGRYDTKASLGEDHLLVKKARKKNTKIRRVKSKIYTSGRKYEENGWFKTTCTHLYLTVTKNYKDNK